MSENYPSGTKRRRLAAGSPSHGLPADPMTVVLFNPALLATIWPVGDEEVDEAHSGPALSATLRSGAGACKSKPLAGWALRMLRRGRRPREVRIWVDEKHYPGQWREGAQAFLRAVRRASGRPGKGVVSLQLPTRLLPAGGACRIARAFPNLSRLTLTGREKLKPSLLQASARSLARLLGVASGAEGGEALAAAGGQAPGGSGGEASAAANGGASNSGVGHSEAPAGGVGVAAGAGGGEARAAAAHAEATAGGGLGHGLKPLLPRLTELEVTGRKGLPPGFAPLLRQATQLRTLDLHGQRISDSAHQGQEAAGPGPLEQLASLTQLSALSLHSCAVPLLPVLAGALTRPTSLELSHQSEPALRPALFAPLKALQRLEIPGARLEVAGLAEALSSLTRLNLRAFTLPAQELAKPLASIPRWRLPGGLRELGLGTKTSSLGLRPEVFAGLELAAGLRFDRGSSLRTLRLRPGRHTAPPGEEGGPAGTELLPTAEEALCGALRFMQAHNWCARGEVFLTFARAERALLLQPVGGAAGTGPGRPNHGRWLREVAALRPSRLTLSGFRLSHQDVAVIGDMAELQALTFKSPCELPAMSLPLLAALPRLEHLGLYATPWSGPDPASSELRGQALASIVGLARARARAPTPALQLQLRTSRSEGNKERVRQLGLRAVEEMGLWGVESVHIWVHE
ncbi:hypothetical protein HYH03_001031 [Edaphochlamys debaryana]|uniref:Uncharacterized protein n=1 Tax=Edaphochlamys debaryana TaxID=47281 RepID=A0A835YHC1_9CHLO|nr:hypothetical protein HYH03_001031 [Edaphochlamys debaryana]|eukprot:KAG2501218.1 hypothetical protein HYH03_001031 [Edaphochlamys debaryana]